MLLYKVWCVYEVGDILVVVDFWLWKEFDKVVVFERVVFRVFSLLYNGLNVFVCINGDFLELKYDKEGVDFIEEFIYGVEVMDCEKDEKMWIFYLGFLCCFLYFNVRLFMWFVY